MFDDSFLARLQTAAADACAADYAGACPDQLDAVLRTVQTTLDRLAGAHARATAAFAAIDGHKQDGCASIGV